MTEITQQRGIVAELTVVQQQPAIVEIVKDVPMFSGMTVPFDGPDGAVLVKHTEGSQWLEIPDLSLWFDNQLT